MRNHTYPKEMYSLLYFKHISETTTFYYTVQCVFIKFTIGFLRSFIAHFRTLENTINMTIILDIVSYIQVWCKAFIATACNGAFSGHWPYQCEVSICISIPTHTEEAIARGDFIVLSIILCLVKHILEGGAVWSSGTRKERFQFSWGHQNKLIFVTETLVAFRGAQVGIIPFLTHNGNRSSFWKVFKTNSRWWTTSKITVKFILTCHHQRYLDSRIQSLPLWLCFFWPPLQ